MRRRLLTLGVLAVGLLLCGLGVALTPIAGAPPPQGVEAGSDDGADSFNPLPTPTTEPTPTPTPTPTPHRGYLPLVQRGYVRGHYLVMEIVLAGSDSVWVIIKVGESSDYGGVPENHEISGGEDSNVTGPFAAGPFWGARESPLGGVTQFAGLCELS